MICPVCGTLNEDHVPFCGGCGGRLVRQQPVAPPPVQQPVYQQPVYQQPVYQQPVYQQSVYQQSVYQQPAYPPIYPSWQPPRPVVKAPVPGRGFAIAGLVLGIASVALFALWVLSGICAVLAIIFSAVAMSKAKQAGRGNGMALAGLIIGAVGLAVAALFGMTVWDIMSTYNVDYGNLGMDFTKDM